MRILLAEDEPLSRRRVEAVLTRLGHEVVLACDGDEAWATLQREDAPSLVVLDWLMPGQDGIDICRKLRAMPPGRATYVILITARGRREDIIEGLRAGADEYLTKPFDEDELRARVQVGVRIVQLQSELERRVRELEDALEQVKRLQGLLPICSYCKRIRDDQEYWHEVEGYLGEHADVTFSHGICPDCYEKVVKPQIQELRQRMHPKPKC